MNITRSLVATFFFVITFLLNSATAFAVEFARPRTLLGENICRMALASNGDIYTFSLLMNGALGYRVISADLIHAQSGEIASAGALLDCPQTVLQGVDGHFFLPLHSQHRTHVYDFNTAVKPPVASQIYQSEPGWLPMSAWLDSHGSTLYLETHRSGETQPNIVVEAINVTSHARQILTRAERQQLIRPASDPIESVADFPVARLNHRSVNVAISPAVIDPASGERYSYYHSLAAISSADAGREWGIWRVNPATGKREIIFRKAGAGKLQSLLLQQGRLYVLAGGELILFHLTEPDMTLDKRWVQTETIIDGRPLPASRDHYTIRWEVKDEQQRIRQQGDMLLGGDNQHLRHPWVWPLQVAEQINAQQAFLQAGEQEKNRHIQPLASSYRNHLWLPADLQLRGWTVSLSMPKADRSAPIRTLAWLRNPVADFAAINLAEGEVLNPHVCLKLDKRQGGNDYITLSALNTDSSYRWAYDLAHAINRSAARNYIGAGEVIDNQLVPLFSKFRNYLWLKSLSDDHEGINYNKYSGFSYQQGSCPTVESL